MRQFAPLSDRVMLTQLAAYSVHIIIIHRHSRPTKKRSLLTVYTKSYQKPRLHTWRSQRNQKDFMGDSQIAVILFV